MLNLQTASRPRTGPRIDWSTKIPASSSAADVRNFWLNNFEDLITAKLKFFTSSNPFTENPEQILLAQQKSQILEEYDEILASREALNTTRAPPPVKPSLNSSTINRKMKDTQSKKQKILVDGSHIIDQTLLNNTEQFFDPIDENEQKTLKNPKNSSPKPERIEQANSRNFQNNSSGIISLDSNTSQNNQFMARNASLTGQNFHPFSPTAAHQHHGMISPIHAGVFPQMVQPQLYQPHMQNFGGLNGGIGDQKDQVSDENMNKIISRIDLYFQEKLKIETTKINTKLNSQSVDISQNRTNIYNNKVKIDQNASKIEEIKNTLPHERCVSLDETNPPSSVARRDKKSGQGKSYRGSKKFTSSWEKVIR